MLRKLQVRDVIAFMIILGSFISNWRGGTFMVPASVLLVVGFYFGAEHQKNNKDENQQQ